MCTSQGRRVTQLHMVIINKLMHVVLVGVVYRAHTRCEMWRVSESACASHGDSSDAVCRDEEAVQSGIPCTRRLIPRLWRDPHLMASWGLRDTNQRGVGNVQDMGLDS
jgi:hypothetical protein